MFSLFCFWCSNLKFTVIYVKTCLHSFHLKSLLNSLFAFNVLIRVERMQAEWMASAFRPPLQFTQHCWESASQQESTLFREIPRLSVQWLYTSASAALLLTRTPQTARLERRRRSRNEGHSWQFDKSLSASSTSQQLKQKGLSTRKRSFISAPQMAG